MVAHALASTRVGDISHPYRGWLISDESFLQNLKAINTLKLRAGYGVAGNNQICNHLQTSLLYISNYVSGGTWAPGLAIGNTANPNLKWERTTQLNIGLDIQLFNDRIGVSAEFYNSTTKDMLLNVPVPDISGFSNQLTNIGQMQNRGIELNLNTKNVVGKLNWSADFNISSNRNKVLQLGSGNAPIIYTDFLVAVKTKVGQPISTFYGYQVDGVIKNQAAGNAAPHFTLAPILRGMKRRT